MKKFLLSLICLISVIAINAETLTLVVGEDITATSGTFLNGAVSLSSAKNSASSAPAYNSNYKQLRLYYHNSGNGCSATFNSDGSINFTGITITAVKSYAPKVMFNIDNGSDVEGSWDDPNADNPIMSLTDINAKEITFRNANTASNIQLRIVEIELTYEEAEVTKVATPVITPNGGEIVANTEVSISCTTEGASIYYTLDGTEPSAENGTLYEAPFTLAEEATVKAVAVADGLENSEIAEAVFTAPAANIAEFIEKSPSKATSISGTVTVVGQAGSYLFLQDETAKIVAFGTLDNTYSNGDQLTGVKGTYELYNGLPELKVVASSFGTATEGTPIEPETITLSELKSTELLTYVKVEGVTIPEGSSKSYTIEDASGTATMYNSASITITSGENLTVYGFVSCYNTTIQLLPIEIISASGLEIVETPVISPNGGAIYAETEISIACATEGASIYYTLDGTEPSAENGTLYEAPFTLAEEATVKAIAVAEGMENSSVAEAAFTLLSGTVASVTFDFTDPSSLNPVQEEPAFGQSASISVNDVVFTSGSVSLSFDKGSATTDCRIWAGNSAYDLRTYKNSTMTISVTGADITNIVFTGSKIGANYVSANVGTFSGKTWSGSSQSVVFTTNVNATINTITVTYDTATAIEEVGVDANAPVEYYNLQGVKVARPENGIFIKKQGSKTTKVVL